MGPARRAATIATLGIAPLAACSSDEPTGTDTAVELPSAIECETFYRPTAGQNTASRRDVITVERVDRAFGEAGATLDLPTMRVDVTYVGDAPDGRTVLVNVDSADGDQLVSDLYQFGGLDLTALDFTGGLGFTGLQYVFHEGAELQLWCRAVP